MQFHNESKMKTLMLLWRVATYYYLLKLATVHGTSYPSSTPGSTTVVRFRTPKTGSIVSLQIKKEDDDIMNTPLLKVIEGVLDSSDDGDYECTLGSLKLDTAQTLSQLGLKHGALLTITNNKSKSNTLLKTTSKHQEQGATIVGSSFDPFPHLAKPRYNDKKRALRAKANRRGGMSYSDLDQLSDNIHKVEIQTDPIITRIYMCSKSAEAFFVTIKKKQQQRKCAMLFGTISKERVNNSKQQGDNGSITSSSSKSKGTMCEVAKVHALWEPPQNKLANSYDATELISLSSAVQRALVLAKRLQLQPVGWIYTYDDDKTKEVPVVARDVVTAAKIQTALMKSAGREAGGRFVTLALHAVTGATEAFQMSDQAIQMAAEGVLLVEEDEPAISADPQFIKTYCPVVVDGKETRTVDCLLCIVNTALLSHTGSLCGNGMVVSSTGKLTSKVKQQLLKHLKSSGDDETIQFLSNFNLLFGLSNILNEADMNELCDVISKPKQTAAGRRRIGGLSKHLQMTLEGIVTV